jgi:hypothetical protein
LTLSGEEVAIDCPGGAWKNTSQYACAWPLTKPIKFSDQFDSAPNVQVTIVTFWTDYTPCSNKLIGGSGYYEFGAAIDASLAFGANITTTGFNLRAGASHPYNAGSCDNSTVADAWVPIIVRWTAFGKKKSI